MDLPLPPTNDAAGARSWWSLFATAGRARLWMLLSGVCALVGILALGERAWTLVNDWHARRTWPRADGEIAAATQQDDSDLAQRYGSVKGRTRYWIEYSVRFAVPAERCRTGSVMEGPSPPMPCRGMVRTRSTTSPAEAFDWLLHGYRVNQTVTVLWDPEGTGTSDVKIVGEPLRRWFNVERLVFCIGWAVGFGLLFWFSSNRLADISRHGSIDDIESDAIHH